MPRVLGHEAGRQWDAEDDAEELGRLGGGGHEAPFGLGEPEDLLVVERGEGDEADDGGRQERQRGPDAAQGAHLPEDAHRLGPRGRELVGGDHVGGGAGRGPLVVAAPGLLQPQAQHHEDHGRDGEEDEGHPPPEGLREDAAEQRADEGAEGVGHAVEPVDLRALVDRV